MGDTSDNGLDRSILPLPEPENPPITEIDARKAIAAAPLRAQAAQGRVARWELPAERIRPPRHVRERLGVDRRLVHVPASR